MLNKRTSVLKRIAISGLAITMLCTASGMFAACEFADTDGGYKVENIDLEEVNRDEGEAVLREGGLAEIYKDYFVVGVSGKGSTFENQKSIISNFNSVSPEYDMKWNRTEYPEGEYHNTSVNNFINLASQNDMGVRGHCLIWYQSTPKWVHDKLGNKCQMDENGQPVTHTVNGRELRIGETEENRELGLEVMRNRIYSAMEQYGDETVYCWDVVNEALIPWDDAEKPLTKKMIEEGDIYRNGENDARHFGKDQEDPGTGETVYWRLDWEKVIGEDFIQQAFQMADDACREFGYDDMDLFYNDYDLTNPMKRDACLRMIHDLQQGGIRIDGIGEQAHYTLESYTADKEKWLTNFETAIQAYTGLGLDFQLTELEITVKGATDGKLTEQQEKDQTEMYSEIFRICRKYSKKLPPWKEGAGYVTGITFWGAADDGSTTSHIFNQDLTPKMAYDAIATFGDFE